MNTSATIRSSAALLGFALMVSSAGIAAAANFAGSWSFSGHIGNYASSAPVCVFRQGGSAISGSCKGPNGIGSVDGSVNGRSLFFHWHVIPTNSTGLGGIATYRGVWGNDGVVRGTWTHSRVPGLYGNFTGQKLQ